MKKLWSRVAATLTAAGLLATALTVSGAGENTYRLEQGRLGVVTIPAFTGESYDTLSKAVTGNDAAVEEWLLDLRGNQGDELSAAADCLSVFLGGGDMLYLRDGAGTVTVNKAEGQVLTADPVIVLVDGKTLGAAELFAASVRDGRAGLVIGSRTGGKGTAQTPKGEQKTFSGGFNNHDVLGVLPHLMVEDAAAPQVARLLRTKAPAVADGWFRFELGGWRWYVDLASADKEALGALLEAIPPQSALELGVSGEWSAVTLANLMAKYAPEHAPRTFADAAGSGYRDAINALKCYGILQGDEMGNFNPKATLDRATLCALLAQAMHYPQTPGTPAFADTPADKWYTPYVNTLSAMGIVNGYDDGLFHPDDPIPHEQFMLILSRMVAGANHMSYVAFQLGPTQEELDRGTYSLYSSWAVNGAWLLDGCWHTPAWAIDPKGPTTREEAAYDLWSALAHIGVLPR